MSTRKNITNIESKIHSELADLTNLVKEIRTMLEQKSSPPLKKEKRQRKPADPNAPKKENPWIVFTGKVRTALTNAKLPAGKQCQQFASHLKHTVANAYEMTEEEIVEAHATWNPPAGKPEETPAPATKGMKKAAAKEEPPVVSQPITPPQPNTPPQPSTGSKLRILPYKSKRYLWDTESNGLWLAQKDGTKGKWAGILSEDGKSIDASAPNPDDTDE